MTRLDDLPPDRRAVLSLLLRQHKRYDEVAGMLQISPGAVHDRAHAALAVLAPRQARELDPAAREQIGEYLLGQQTRAQREQTRAYLARTAPARAWAQALSAELAALAAGALPDIPSGGVQPRSSRRGGALLLAAIAAVVIVAVILIAGSGGGSGGTTTGTTGNASATGTSSTSTTGASGTGSTAGGPTPKIDKRIALTSPDPASKAVGVVEVLSQGGRRAFYVAAENLLPSKGFVYAVWLYNSPSDAVALGSLPTVGANGRSEAIGALPSNAAHYHHVSITRETNQQPAHPGPTVVSGSFSTH